MCQNVSCWDYSSDLLAVLIAVATTYGRYHFAIDTLAGLGMALAALGLRRVTQRT